MPKSNISAKRGIAAAGLLAVLAVATVPPVSAQAPVVEPRPPVERQQTPPLITPPGAQRRDAPRPAEPVRTQTDQGQEQTDATGRPQTAPFRQPVLVTDDDGSDPRPMAGGPQEGMGSFVIQLQQLQQEVMMLRGMVESQQNTIARLEREQRERYLDLDRRLARGGSAAPEQALDDPMMTLDSGVGAGGSADERSAYEAAFNLTRDRQFEQAISRFRELISDYPGGAYEANSWYWLGELYLALDNPDLEESRAAFVQVLERWPDHNKVPDALYKLGVVYHQLGETDEARRYLDRVRSEHSGSSAARLATTYRERL